MNKIKVKVDKCSVDAYWYATRIGEIFDVHPHIDADGDYRCVDVLGSYIAQDDCTVVSLDMLREHRIQAKAVVAELDKQIAEEEALLPFTLKEYEKVVAAYRACCGRKKFVAGEEHYVASMCAVIYPCFVRWQPSNAPFGVFFKDERSAREAFAKVGEGNLKKAWDYEMSIGFPR